MQELEGSVLLLGGPKEAEIADEIMQSIDPSRIKPSHVTESFRPDFPQGPDSCHLRI